MLGVSLGSLFQGSARARATSAARLGALIAHDAAPVLISMTSNCTEHSQVLPERLGHASPGKR